MMPKFIELHDKDTDIKLSFNVGLITVFGEGTVDTDREGFEVSESYDEIKQLIKDTGALIHKADPRLDPEPLKMDQLRKLIGEPVYSPYLQQWLLVVGKNEYDGVDTMNTRPLLYSFDEEELIRRPLYRMKVQL